MLQVDNLIEVVNNFLRKSSNILQPSSRCLIKICCSLIKSTTSLIARLTETRAASWVRERHLIALKRGLETVNAISSIRKVHESLIIIIKLTKKLNPVLRAEHIGEGDIKLHPRHHGVIPNCCASYHIPKFALLSNLATICRNIRLNQESHANNIARRARRQNRRYCLDQDWIHMSTAELGTHTLHFRVGRPKKIEVWQEAELQLFAECNGETLLKRQNEKNKNEINKLRQSEQIKQQICMRYIWWIMFPGYYGSQWLPIS